MKSPNKLPPRVQPENGSNNGRRDASIPSHSLNEAQVAAIDRAIEEIGDFGEIHLIIKRGQLRFIGKLKTEAMESES